FNENSATPINVDNPYLDHYTDALWGIKELCQKGHAFAFDMKYEQPGAIDQTAVNAMKLYCRDDSDGSLSGQLVSFEGKYGQYLGLRTCPNDNDKMTGFRLQVWPYQGTFGDDWAIDNVQIACTGNTTLDGMGNNVSEEEMKNEVRKFPARSISENMEVVDISIESKGLIHGEWTEWAFCSDSYYISGIQTMVGEGHPFSDDTGLTDMYLYCSTV
ncbi:unnamed protein product, partial [Meganyctiphanes norvegica]